MDERLEGRLAAIEMLLFALAQGCPREQLRRDLEDELERFRTAMLMSPLEEKLDVAERKIAEYETRLALR